MSIFMNSYFKGTKITPNMLVSKHLSDTSVKCPFCAEIFEPVDPWDNGKCPNINCNLGYSYIEVPWPEGEPYNNTTAELKWDEDR